MGIPTDHKTAQALMDALRKARLNKVDKLDVSRFKKTRYAYRGEVLIMDKKVKIIAEHWFFSGKHELFGINRKNIKATYNGKLAYIFSGSLPSGSIVDMLKIIIDKEDQEIMDEYLLYEQKQQKRQKPKPGDPLMEMQVKIIFGINANQNTISKKSIEILKDIGRRSKNYTIKITSTARTPYSQARAMYDNMYRTDSLAMVKRINQQYNLYKNKESDLVIAVFERYVNLKKRKQVIQLMADKINELGPSKISGHLRDYNVTNVFDVAHSSIDNINEFYNEAKKDKRITKILDEPKNSCYHFEIPQTP